MGWVTVVLVKTVKPWIHRKDLEIRVRRSSIQPTRVQIQIVIGLRTSRYVVIKCKYDWIDHDLSGGCGFLLKDREEGRWGY